MARFRYWSGVLLIACALGALTASVVVGSYVGGSTWYGGIEDGRYFVGGHGTFTEVSAAEWYLELRVSQAFPWSVLVPGLLGLMLVCADLPPPPPPKPFPPPGQVALASLVGYGVFIVCAWLGWLIGRAPWTTTLGGCLGAYLGFWLIYRLVLILQEDADESALCEGSGLNTDPALATRLPTSEDPRRAP